MNKPYLILLASILFLSTLNATTYYVDQQSGNDSNPGVLPSSAWKTVSRINSALLLPGDTVLLKAGQIWREQLTINVSGLTLLPITFASYGTGEKPVISGADIQTGFVLYSGFIWKKPLAINPQQVFFNSIRGNQKTSLSSLASANNWYYDITAKCLYIYSVGNPATTCTNPGIEAAIRNYSVYVNGDNIVIKDLQVEKTANSALFFSANSESVTADNLTFLQWTNEESSTVGGITIAGKNCTISNSTFGKKTGDEINDQNWAGFMAIYVVGSNTGVFNNSIFHSSTENENGNGSYAYGIRINLTSGTTKISGNFVYHTGGNGIYVTGYSKSGDVIEINENTVAYSGQAGISAYKTRASDGIGGKGYVSKNNVSYADRLGGDVGGNNTQSAGIHFNDGVRSGTEAGKPYIKWYCYENSVSNSQALKVPNGPDADGIALDYNANGVEVFRNTVFNNYGKGIYVWNANNCKIYYNLVYGNDVGITVSALKGVVESSDNNLFYNNTFYKNYNGQDKGPNYNSEIYFGWYGNNNIFKNNIVFASANGYAYTFATAGSSGCILDFNNVYSESGSNALIGYDGTKGKQTYTQWRTNHPTWDVNSVNADPLFNNTAAGDFSLKSNSPDVNKGAALGLSVDLPGNSLYGQPDIGAFENIYRDLTPPTILSAANINDVSVKVIFSEKVNSVDALSLSNYSISNNVAVTGVQIDTGETTVMLTTSVQNSGTFVLRAANIKDLAGNIIDPNNCSGSYCFTAAPIDTLIRISPEQGILTGSAALKTQSGSLSNKVAYFANTDGSITFNVNLPKSGYWYAWARLYYGNASANNSFFIAANNLRHVLGDDSTKYNMWHYDGYKHASIHIGKFVMGENTITITPREPGQTVMLDQIILTPDYNFVPKDEKEQNIIILNAMDGTFSGDARLGSMTGMKNTRAAYFKGTIPGVSLSVNIPQKGKWYAWARMYYMSSGGKNSFFISVNSKQYVLGDNDAKYNQWYWDGYLGSKIDLDTLNAGANSIIISGREPGLTLWVDQVVLTDDPNYNPNILGKEITGNNETVNSVIPTEYNLSQNYPNPFNPSTTIRFSLPEAGFVSLKIYDILGNEVGNPVNEVINAGYHEINFNASNLASGVYIYQLKANAFIKTKKMQLLK